MLRPVVVALLLTGCGPPVLQLEAAPPLAAAEVRPTTPPAAPDVLPTWHGGLDVLAVHSTAVMHLALSNHHGVSAALDGEVRMWRREDGQGRLLQASADLAPLAVGLDDAHVVAVRETEVRVWSVEDELVYRLTSDTPLLAGTFPEAGVVLLEVEREDGSRLVAWDVAARKPRWSASVEVTGVGHAAHGPDGLAWVPAGEGDLQARDLRKGEVMGTVQAHEQPLQSVAYASRKLLAVAEDGASLRDTVYDNPVIEVPGGRLGALHPTGQYFAVADEQVVRLYDREGLELGRMDLAPTGEQVTALAFGDQLLVGTDRGVVYGTRGALAAWSAPMQRLEDALLGDFHSLEPRECVLQTTHSQQARIEIPLRRVEVEVESDALVVRCASDCIREITESHSTDIPHDVWEQVHHRSSFRLPAPDPAEAAEALEVLVGACPEVAPPDW